MVKIEVQTQVVDVKNGTSAKTGKPYSIREQEAWAYCFDKSGKPYPHPQKIKLTLEDTEQPYPLGTYTLDPASLYVDRFGQLALRAKLRASVAQSRAA